MTVLEQPDIWGSTHTVAANGKPLTEKQQLAWDWIREVSGGLTADELGALFHSRKGKHGPDLRCQWCCAEGRSVADSAALKPLLIRRKTSGRYEPRERPPARPLEPLPDGTWEDLF